MSDPKLNARSIFITALELQSPAEQDEYVARACGDNASLRRRVEALIKADREAGSFLAEPEHEVDETVAATPSETVGMRVGPYKLLQQIGEGGMGAVYMADQAEPVQRRVALKIIKPGMDTGQVIARFEAERKALAMMDHPNIAKVLDAGSTDAGRPYFVMELVKGIPITRYCDEQHFTTRQRLELFIEVCHAVDHAHQKEIIHRDLKPSNVLVAEYDHRAVPKVIDFGVAKATSQKLTEKTMFTQFGQIVGTLEYMSPEQAKLNQLDIDARSDIYSLGVLLYELLIGTTPFDRQRLRSAAFDEMLRIIREEEPPKPSTKLSASDTLPGIAANRNTEPRRLTRLVRGDLDWIVMKALAKERHERYQSAPALAADIRRYLDDQPIEARRPSALGRARRFVRRNKLAVALSSCIAIAAIAAAGFAFYGDVVRDRLNAAMAESKGLKVQERLQKEREVLQQRARQMLPEVERLVDEGYHLAAFDLARRAQQHIPDDPALLRLWPRVSKSFKVTSEPSGATVFYKDYLDEVGKWRRLGITPIQEASFPHGMFRWKFELPGFKTVETCGGDVFFESLDVTLPNNADAPAGMSYIPGGTLGVPLQSLRHVPRVETSGFWIDRCEVTNAEFQQFVHEGGYERASFWKHEFRKDGVTLTFDEAMAEFVDSTGQPGPSTWKGGTFPDGTEMYPVTGVSWYEAAAYAEFVGKRLPTAFHWSKAAEIFFASWILRGSNIEGDSLAPVGSFPAISPYGLRDMAGNAREWCQNSNKKFPNQKLILGGAWNETSYVFSGYLSLPPWQRTATNGFRCVKFSAGSDVPVALFDPLEPEPFRDISGYEPISDETFQGFKDVVYAYDELEPNAHVEEAVTVDNWRRETITFDAAYEWPERVTAYLYLPTATGAPPYQLVVYYPHSGAKPPFNGLEQRFFTEMIIESGRALLFPVYDGTYDRVYSNFRAPPVEFRERRVRESKDMRRAIDCVETRPDIDKQRIAYYGVSAGAWRGPIMMAVEDRFRCGVLAEGGLPRSRYDPVVEVLNLAPRVKVPVLMINGEHDTIFPRESHRGLYERLGTKEEEKELLIYEDAPHAIGQLYAARLRQDIIGWLDRWLGPAERQ